MKTLNVIYIGERVHDCGTLSSCFILGKKTFNFKKVKGYHSVGETYALKVDENNQYNFPRLGLEASKKQKPVKETEIEEWENETELARQEVRMIRERKKIKNDPKLFKEMRNIRKMYFTASKDRKAAIELSLIYWLRR